MAKQLSPKQKSAVERVKRNPGLQRILLSKAKGLEWYSAFAEAGFFNPASIPPPVAAKQPGYFSFPGWPIADYLASARDELIQDENKEIAVEVRNFMRASTAHARASNFTNHRVWWNFSKIISCLPINLIEAEDLSAVDFWLDDPYERGLVAETIGETWLFGLMDQKDEQSRQISLQLLEMLYRTKQIERTIGRSKRPDIVLRADSWYAQKLTTKVAGKVGRVLRTDGVRALQRSLESIVADLNNDGWSSIWRPAIEDHEQNRSSDDAEDIILVAYRDAVAALAGEAHQDGVQYLTEIIQSQFVTLKRIAIYAVGVQFDRMRALLDRVLVIEHFSSHYRHELWSLLQSRYPHFNAAERTRAVDLIIGLTESDDGKPNAVATAYTRAIWLSAIKNYADDLSRLYAEAVAAAGAEPEHPDFASYMTVGSVNHESPISEDELRSLSVPQLVERLNSYEDTGGGYDEPGLAGLVKAVRQAVKAEPLRYYGQLNLFATVDSAFIYGIIESFNELWTEKAKLPWEEIWRSLLEFCADVINAEGFWSEENSADRAAFVGNRHWIVGALGRLIENGVKSDDHAFPEAYLDQAKTVLVALLEKEPGAEFNAGDDAVLVAINSSRGRCIEALINLALRSCRLSDKRSKEHSEVWDGLEPLFDAELARAEGGLEFATLVTVYLGNFLYMSKKWVVEHVDVIFDSNDYQRWLCAMQGYAHVNAVYEPIYKALRGGGHFIRALDDEHAAKKVANKIVQNIAVAYLNYDEKLDDDGSLIRQLLQRGRSSEIGHLIAFFPALRGEVNDHVRSKIIELWPKLFAALDINTREGRVLASRLCDWTAFFDQIDDTSKPLILALIPFANEAHHEGKLLESIVRFSAKQPKEAFELWRTLLEHAWPTYPPEGVEAALTNLVGTGGEGIRMAKTIASLYMEHGEDEPAALLAKIRP